MDYEILDRIESYESPFWEGSLLRAAQALTFQLGIIAEHIDKFRSDLAPKYEVKIKRARQHLSLVKDDTSFIDSVFTNFGGGSILPIAYARNVLGSYLTDLRTEGGITPPN